MAAFARISALALSTVCLCLTTSTFADGAAPSDFKNGWQFDVAPYLWAMKMNGTEQVGTRRAHIKMNFSEIIDHMNFGAMIWLDARKGNLGLFLNALYADLVDNGHDGELSVNATNHFGIFSVGGSYQLYKLSSFSVDPYIGLRYTLNDTTIKASIPGLTLTNSNNQNWTDPFIGLRLRYDLTKALSANLDGDIGGTNTTDHYSYNVAGLIGYNPQTTLTNTTFYAGYRILDQHYETGSGANYFNWNMKISGPLVGIMINF